MRTIYIAEDGTEFNNVWDCEDYEALLSHQEIYNIAFFDEMSNKTFVKHGDEFNDDLYNYAEKIIVHNERELECLKWITDYCGWCEFEDITSPGTWIREVDEEVYSYYKDSKWKKVGDIS